MGVVPSHAASTACRISSAQAPRDTHRDAALVERPEPELRPQLSAKADHAFGDEHVVRELLRTVVEEPEHVVQDHVRLARCWRPRVRVKQLDTLLVGAQERREARSDDIVVADDKQAWGGGKAGCHTVHSSAQSNRLDAGGNRRTCRTMLAAHDATRSEVHGRERSACR